MNMMFLSIKIEILFSKVTSKFYFKIINRWRKGQTSGRGLVVINRVR